MQKREEEILKLKTNINTKQHSYLDCNCGVLSTFNDLIHPVDLT